jgi:hypothetical protein
VKYRDGINNTQRERGRQVCMKGNEKSKKEKVNESEIHGRWI